MEESDADDDWRPETRQRVARWVMLFAISAFALTAVSGAISIVLTR
jgi:hypothetical protein